MIYHKMTDRDLERLQSLAVEAALIVQDYRPAGTDTIEWMAQCDQYRELTHNTKQGEIPKVRKSCERTRTGSLASLQ